MFLCYCSVLQGSLALPFPAREKVCKLQGLVLCSLLLSTHFVRMRFPWQEHPSRSQTLLSNTTELSPVKPADCFKLARSILLAALTLLELHGRWCFASQPDLICSWAAIFEEQLLLLIRSGGASSLISRLWVCAELHERTLEGVWEVSCPLPFLWLLNSQLWNSFQIVELTAGVHWGILVRLVSFFHFVLQEISISCALYSFTSQSKEGK